MMLVNPLQTPNTSVVASFCISGVDPGTTYYAADDDGAASQKLAAGADEQHAA
jgi:hypothetical protein